MDFRLEFRKLVAAGALVAVLVPGSLAAQNARALGWSDVAELTFLLTSGNASSSTFGFKNTAEHLWEKTALKVGMGAVRAKSGFTTRTATGTPEDFTIAETTEKVLTVENYYLNGRVDRTLGASSFLYGGADWTRNTFAGIQNRYGFVAGTGKGWAVEGVRALAVDLGLTFTLQDDVVENPSVKDSFLGLRGSFDFAQTLTESTNLTSVLIVDENLNTTDDLRMDWTNSIAVSMSERLALKTSLQLLFDNLPALTSVPLDDTEVLTPLGKWDTLFSVAVVASF